MSKKPANVKSFLAKKKTRNEKTVQLVAGIVVISNNLWYFDLLKLAMSSGHKKLANWNTEDIVFWLKSQSFGEYANNFKEYAILGHEFALMDLVDFQGTSCCNNDVSGKTSRSNSEYHLFFFLCNWFSPLFIQLLLF